jgi:PadR family transcriptional regulator, regulatory protein PadR
MPMSIDDNISSATAASSASRFELAPPRRFMLPAVLLLLSERPGYGYGLVPRLQDFRFGHVDRPAVYRALAQLERDGLVEASSQSPTAGQARRVYRVTQIGNRVLRAWMGVIKEEHDYLGQVLRRYQATATTDAVLAEVEGGWAAALGFGWSPVAPTSAAKALVTVDSDSPAPDRLQAVCEEAEEPRNRPQGAVGVQRFRLIPDRSVVLIEVRSTVGPLAFGAIGVDGWMEAAVAGATLQTDIPPAAHLEIDLSGLRSGNRVYDAELARRIDSRRFPQASADLRECLASGPANLFRLNGELTFHGVTRQAQGTVRVEVTAGGRLVISGDQAFDIRDFAIPSPTVLMLRIYPDIKVRLHAEAELEAVQ